MSYRHRLERFVEGETARTIYVLPPSGRMDPLRTDIAALLAERDKLRAAISWVEQPFVDDATPEAELRKRVEFLIVDAQRASGSAEGVAPGQLREEP